MGDSVGTTPFCVPGNPDVASMFDTTIGDDMGDDADHFAAPGNPDVASMMGDGRVADLPRFASPGNPSGVSG